MCGWFNEDAVCASRWKRVLAAASAMPSDRNLMAAGRLSFVSSAR
jgi:hypothetical protein